MQDFNSLLSLGRNLSADRLENFNWSDPHPPLRVVTLNDPILLSVQLQPNGSYGYSGYLYELWGIVASRLNLNYRLVPLSVPDFGALDANDTWTGLVGELAYGRADVALASLDMASDRASVVDFLDACPVDEATSAFIVRRGFRDAPQLSSLLGSLLSPLGTNVWWALIVSLLILAVILRRSLHFNRGRAETLQTVDKMLWTDCILVCYMSMVGQGWSTTPNSLAARMVTIACWILGIIICASYTANLISHLTLVTEELSINSLEEFSGRPDWKLVAPAGNSELNKWRSSSDVHERALYQRYATGKGIIVMNLTSNASNVAMIQEHVLTYADLKYIPVLLGPDACLLVPIPTIRKRTVSTFIAVSKRLKTLRRRINQLLLKMKTGGLISRLRHRWIKSSEIICESPTGYKAITFNKSLPLLALVPLSLCASVVLLVLEWAFSL